MGQNSVMPFVLASLLALPAWAADPTESVAPAAAQKAEAKAEPAVVAKADEDPIVCKTTRTVGTRFEKRVCGPKSTWERITKKAEEDFGAIRNRPELQPDIRE